MQVSHHVPRRGGGLVPALVGFVGGTLVQLQQANLWAWAVYAGFCAVALAAFWLAGTERPGTPSRTALSLLAAASIGFGTAGWRATAYQADALDPALEGRDLRLTGMVAAMPQRNEAGVRFLFDTESAIPMGTGPSAPVTVPPRVSVGWYNAAWSGASDASATAHVPDLRAGERWSFTVRLKAPHAQINPHTFDAELRFWEQDVQALGTVRDGARDLLASRLGDSLWRHPVERARQSVRDAIVAAVPDRPTAGVVAALVTGDQNAIERADWDVFRATGVAHLMSISGLHITMFAWLAGLCASTLWRCSTRLCLALPAPAAALWGGVAVAGLYALFSGWGVPAQRTVWMLVAAALLRQIGVRWPWWVRALLAMAVVVAVDPWCLLQAGFWLSFVAVSVLFLADPGASSPAGGTLAQQAARRFRALLQEQATVTLALAPLGLLLFHQVSMVGLLANLVAIPWITLVVTPLALLGVVISPLWQGAAMAVQGLGGLLQAMAQWPGAAVSLPAAPLALGVAGVVGGAWLTMKWPWWLRALGVPLVLAVVLWQPPRPADGQFELLAPDVGQGNAVLVRTARHSLLFDAGPRYGSDSDAGQRVLLPLLRALDEPLQTVMLSHRDLDHTGGAVAVLANQPRAELRSSIEPEHPIRQQRDGPRCEAGQHWSWDGVEFQVLHPLPADYGPRTRSNALSCVLRVSAGGHAALLTGDIEAAQEMRLVAAGAPLRADFLLVPHHGSKTSSTTALLEAVRPRVALVQAGYRNRFGHPAAEVLARYRTAQVLVLQSPRCGALTWRSDAPADVDCHRLSSPRYWHHALP